MTASSSPVTTESLLEVLEQERRYYEVLRSLAKDQRAALYRGDIEKTAELLAQEEPQVFRAAEATETRQKLEDDRKSDGLPLIEARAETLKSLRLFALENKQNLEVAQRRLDEIHLSLGALNATEERPGYPGAAGLAAKARPSYLDRKV